VQSAGGFPRLVEQSRGRRRGRSRGEHVVAQGSLPGRKAVTAIWLMGVQKEGRFVMKKSRPDA
jgi:hypothetical protein